MDDRLGMDERVVDVTSCPLRGVGVDYARNPASRLLHRRRGMPLNGCHPNCLNDSILIHRRLSFPRCDQNRLVVPLRVCDDVLEGDS